MGMIIHHTISLEKAVVTKFQKERLVLTIQFSLIHLMTLISLFLYSSIISIGMKIIRRSAMPLFAIIHGIVVIVV